MPRLPFVGQSARDDDNRQGNTSRLINVYREPLGMGGKSTHALKSVLGTSPVVSTGNLFVRDMVEVNNRLYIMANDTLYSINSAGAITTHGSTDADKDAMIFGAEQGRVCTVANGRYFVWNGTTMQEPTPAAFSSFGSGAFFSNYVLLSEKNGRRLQWSDLADATTLPALNFATAESTDKAILRIVPLQGRVLIFKEDATEIWYATGDAGANAFTRLAGGVQEIGLKAKGLVTRFTGGCFFVGNDNIAYVTNGGQFQPVSGPAVNTAIAQSRPTECFTYEDEGHIFCVIRFEDRPAWVYDLATTEWHERASGSESPWAVRAAAQAFGKWYVGDALGAVSEMTRNNMDGASALIRTCVSSTLYNEGKRFRVPMVEFTSRMGRGMDNSTGEIVTLRFPDGRTYYNGFDDLVMEGEATFIIEPGYVDEPSILIDFSGDGGNTWSRQRSRDLGALGEYDQLCRVYGLGSFRQVACRIRMAAPKDITLDADVNVQVA